MYLGIEIGGTKLQLAIGGADAELVELARAEVDPRRGAQGILADIEKLATPLLKQHKIRGVGMGFGGPVDIERGRVLKSHHIAGWADFPLADWAREKFGVPVAIANDADTAALAEARLGAGRDRNPVFYITVGTGIGGGLILDGQIYRGSGLGAAEIGHLRPGLHADVPDQHLESYAAGWGIAAAAQARLAQPVSLRIDEVRAGDRPLVAENVRQRLIEVEEADEEDAADLLKRCHGQPERLTAKLVGEAARDGNRIAREVLDQAWLALGWGIAQMITLLAPQVVVVGGGVSLLGDELFFQPVRREVERFVFPPFLGKYEIVPASLGEEVVLHGAVLLPATAP